jgi:hypothetical protein
MPVIGKPLPVFPARVDIIPVTRASTSYHAFDFLFAHFSHLGISWRHAKNTWKEDKAGI